MRQKKDEQRKRKIKMSILAIIVLSMLISLVCGYKKAVCPILDQISTIKAQAIVTDIINTIGEKTITQFKGDDKLFIVNKNVDGDIQTIQGNTAVINKITTNFSTRLQEKYDNIKDTKIKISYGTAIGSRWLSQVGPNITIKILPLAVSKCNVVSDFTSTGINQTKYKIYLKVDSKVKILRPFYDKDIKVSNSFIIAETVIMGKVPSSYVQVPKEDILDVTDE